MYGIQEQNSILLPHPLFRGVYVYLKLAEDGVPNFRCCLFCSFHTYVRHLEFAEFWMSVHELTDIVVTCTSIFVSVRLWYGVMYVVWCGVNRRQRGGDVPIHLQKGIFVFAHQGRRTMQLWIPSTWKKGEEKLSLSVKFLWRLQHKKGRHSTR